MRIRELVIEAQTETIVAKCKFEVTEGEIGDGQFLFKQDPGKPTLLVGRVTGLAPGEHGFHIHEFGDLSDGCKSAGGHYNPDNVDHGDIDKGHVGDLGNIVANEEGIADISLVLKRVDLHGDRSVVGRALIVHADKDDLGKGGDAESLKTGNAGERLGCGVIRLATLNESDDFDPTDNPTNKYMAQQRKAADNMAMADYNKEFDYADKYLSNTEAHKKPYHFIDPATGKTSGEGPYFGIVFGKLPQNDREWMKLGFTKAVNGAWFINNQYLKKLVDQGVIG